jgi:Fur family ferric uptake transcriptional regulator
MEPVTVAAGRDLDKALDRLRALQQRVTPARVAVLSVLATAHDHLDAAEIVNQAATKAPGVHRATVYRALSTLCDLGLVTHTHLANAGSVYHLQPADRERHSHAHLQCSGCGTLFDLPADALEPLVRRVNRELGFTLEPQHAALLGVCAACRDAAR